MSRESADKVGVIGLGIIGSRVAARLRENEHQVYVWSRTPRAEPNFVGSPAEMATLVSTIQIFVSNGDALLEVIEAMAPRLTKGHLVINHATVDPRSAVDAYQMVRDAGAAFLDAPFTGSRDAAASGALTYYVGGDPKILESTRPLLEITSKDILHVGRVGEATVLKLATNMISATTVEVLSEAYGLVRSAGIEPQRLQEALELNACSSTLTGMKFPTMIEGDFETHFSLKHMFKDAQYALNLAKDLEIDLPALSTTANVMFRAIQGGKGDQDYSVLAQNYQEDAK
ncbi:MAG: NAD(P)-dependent oxidoreductase [Verrucomicrobiota bacterium]